MDFCGWGNESYFQPVQLPFDLRERQKAQAKPSRHARVSLWSLPGRQVVSLPSCRQMDLCQRRLRISPGLYCPAFRARLDLSLLFAG